MLKEVILAKDAVTLIGEQTLFTFMIFIETNRDDPWFFRPDENKILVCPQEDDQMVHEPIFKVLVKEEFSAWLLQNQSVLESLVAVSKVLESDPKIDFLAKRLEDAAAQCKLNRN